MTEGFLRQWLYNTLGWMHQKRLDTLSALVFSALRGSDLTVTSLGRFLDEATSQKHNIKRADRLLSNKLLQSELLELYRSVNKCILKSIKSPIIHVDWSDIDERQKFFLLRATTALEGRAVTVYEEVHGIETKEKRITHAKFLEKLKKVLPEHSQAIIVTDAGFRGPWFGAVEELGWDWIGRVRNRELIKLKTQGNWQGVVDLHPLANKTPKDLGSALLTQSAPLECRIVLYKAKPKGRVKKTKFGKKARTKKSLKNASAQKAPWLLATSLKNISAKNIIKTYALRMQIEESFRELKSARFGFGFEYSGTRSVSRFNILVLIGSLATLFAYLIGVASFSLNLHTKFQVNTKTKTRVLSYVFLGIRVLRSRYSQFTRKIFEQTWSWIHLTLAKYALN